MIYAEWKKLLHNGAFRIFLCLFLLAGALSPLFIGLDRTTPEVYEAYEGMAVEEVIARLEGINCAFRGTSCPDQLAKALKQIQK